MALSAAIKKWIATHIKEAQFDVKLDAYTSLRIGGKAEIATFPTTIEELEKLVRFCWEKKIPYTVIGGGTNVLIPDNGVSGIVIFTTRLTSAITAQEDLETGKIKITAHAGVSLQKLCRFAIRQGFSGFNRVIGIPGTLGGAIQMNAGTQKGTIGDFLHEVSVITQKGERRSFQKNQMSFEYRRFVLHEIEKKESIIIVKALFLVSKGSSEELKKEAEEFLVKRKKTQPLRTQNAGCFFKNPSSHSAGELIDKAGLKGLQVGGAMVSTKHANFLINHDNATAKDMKMLAKRVQQTVKQKFGIELEREVRELDDKTKTAKLL